MEKRPHKAIDTVLSCVFPYIQNSDDRWSVSSVCGKLYELDCMTRKHVTVHVFYTPTPSRVHQQFPSIESLTLKGLPVRFPEEKLNIDIYQWIQEIAISFKHLKSLQIRHMDVHDSDLELLARTRGRDLRVLKISKCKGFSTDGLLHFGKHCNDLRTLCLTENKFNNKDGKWLHELALQNTGIESLDFRYFIHATKDVTLLAKNSSRSLVSLRISGNVDLIDVFSHVVRLEEFLGGTWFKKDQVYADFKFPTSMRCMGIINITKSSFPFVLPFVHQLRELHLVHVDLNADSRCFLIQSCPNLEVLETTAVSGSIIFQVIGQFCKKLRKLKSYGCLAQIGFISVVIGCLELECLHINLADISNETMECIGTHLKNLRDFNISLSSRNTKTSLPLDNGIRAMLIGCGKLERLGILLRRDGLTGVGLGYIGKYGHNLRHLSLGYLGESAVELVCLSKGCPKLCKLEIRGYPFSKQTLATFMYDMHRLRYMSVWDVDNHLILAMTHPSFQPSKIGKTC